VRSEATTAKAADPLGGNFVHPGNKKAFRDRKAFFERNGAGDEIRTHDIHLGKVALYH
jgi:hypothetical protein